MRSRPGRTGGLLEWHNYILLTLRVNRSQGTKILKSGVRRRGGSHFLFQRSATPPNMADFPLSQFGTRIALSIYRAECSTG